MIAKRLIEVDSKIKAHQCGDRARRVRFDELLAEHRRLGNSASFRATVSLSPALPDTREFWGRTGIPQRLEAGSFRLRSVLLGLGALLLMIAAVVFATVAWPHLDNSGRAAVLLAVTTLTGFLAVVVRKRLPATAETFDFLFVVFALVDWYAIRNAGIGAAIATLLWWAIGSVVMAVVTAGMAVVFGFTTSRLAAAVLVLASASLVIADTISTPWPAAWSLAGLAALAVLTAIGLDRPRWRPAAVVLATGGAVFVIASAGFAATMLDSAWSYSRVLTGLTIVAVALPILITRVMSVRLRPAPWGDFAVAGITLCACSGAVTAAASFANDDQLLIWCALAGAIAIAFSRVVGKGAAWAALPFVVVPAGYVAFVFQAAAEGCVSWFATPWSGSASAPAAANAASRVQGASTMAVGWSTIAILAVLIVAAAAFAVRLPQRFRTVATANGSETTTIALVFAMSAGVSAVAMVPLVIGASITAVAFGGLVLVAGLTVASILFVKRFMAVAKVAVGLVLPVIVWSLGWAFADRWLSVVGLGSVVVMAAAGTVAHRRIVPRATMGVVFVASGLTWVLVTLLAFDVSVAVAAFAATLVAGVVLILSVHLAANDLVAKATQQMAVFGIIAMVVLAYATLRWGDAALTVTVPIFAIAALGSRQHTYRWFAGTAAVLATWAWLATSTVTLVEAYTVPAAFLALAAGYVLRKTQASSTSWAAYGPGLTIALGPSLFLAVTEHGTARPETLFIVGVSIVGFGAWRRLQAPITLGAATVAILAVDTLWPVAARLERWVLLSLAGALFIWLGATVEGRIRQVRRVHDGLRHLH